MRTSFKEAKVMYNLLWVVTTVGSCLRMLCIMVSFPGGLYKGAGRSMRLVRSIKNN